MKTPTTGRFDNRYDLENYVIAEIKNEITIGAIAKNAGVRVDTVRRIKRQWIESLETPLKCKCGGEAKQEYIVGGVVIQQCQECFTCGYPANDSGESITKWNLFINGYAA